MKRVGLTCGMILLALVLLVSWVHIALSAGALAAAAPAGLIPSSFKEIKIDDDTKITWGGDFRLRYEYLKDFDFDDEHNDKDGLWYGRTRFNVGATINEHVFLFFEGLDAREWDSDKSPKAQEDNFDFHQGYLKISKPCNIPLSLTIGRQKFEYGAKRLVGAPIWANKIRSFDAVKLTYNPASFDVDLFVGNRVFYQDDHFNDAYWGEDFFGAYVTYKGIAGAIFDFYCLNLVDRRHELKSERRTYGDLERYTIGTRGEGKIPSTAFGYGYEFAYQLGEKASDDINAYAYHVDLNYAFKEVFAQPTVKIEYNFASGDGDPNDGDSKTFDPLFQTVHEPYGIIDFFRWQNVHHAGLTLDWLPLNVLKCSLQYHRFYLDETEDAWYNTSGKNVRNGTSRDVSNYVGDEVDLYMKYKVTSFLELEGGYAHFFAGDYVKDTGSSDDADWFYLQTVIMF